MARASCGHAAAVARHGTCARNALSSTAASSSKRATLATISSALCTSRVNIRRACASASSAFAAGIRRRTCQLRGRKGSGAAAGGQRAASMPVSHRPSKLMPATVCASITSNGTSSSCGSKATSSAYSRSNCSAAVASRGPVTSSADDSVAMSSRSRSAIWCSALASASPGQPSVASISKNRVDHAPGMARS